MEPLILKAKPITEIIYQELKQRIQELEKQLLRKPRLVVVLIGQNPASILYVNKKSQVAESLGVEHQTFEFPESVSPEKVKSCIQNLNENDLVDGILIQRPLPKQFKNEEIVYWVTPEKDVDGFHPIQLGRLNLGLAGLYSCTPNGIIDLLKYYQIPLEGRTACVVGRSPIVGKPLAALLLQENSTVIQCHQQTKSLSHWTRQAEILVVAAGRPQLINLDYIKPGAVVVDVGTHQREGGTVVGDVDFQAVFSSVSAITPVPGGVGPMTIAHLMKNTVLAAEKNYFNRS